MPKNPMTTDELAAMIERNVAHKEDIESLRTDMTEGFTTLAASVETLASSIRKGFEDVTELLRKMSGTLEAIAKDKTVLETDHGLVEKRVSRIEKRLHL
jgi:hypothetical protein